MRSTHEIGVAILKANLIKYGARFIPLEPRGKKPIRKFKGTEFSTTELMDHIKQGGNLGLLAQPNFIFIDIDTKEAHADDGFSNFTKWLTDNGLDPEKIFNETTVQKTPSGGLHLIFRRPENFHLSQNIGFLPGVDIKASKNNYIVFSPSVINGKHYKIINDVDPAVAPMPLINAILAQAHQENEQRKFNQKQSALSGEPDQNGLVYRTYRGFERIDVFYNIEHGFSKKGMRNATMFAWAQAMRKITNEKTAIKFALMANEHSDPPSPKSEVISTIKSAYQFAPELQTVKASGITWVLLDNTNVNSSAVLAVPLTLFEIIGSPSPDDYQEDQLRVANESDRDAPANQLKTIWNYASEKGW